MDVKELTELLVESSEKFNRARFIPWWEGNHKDAAYQYDMLEEKTIKEAEECLAECGKEALLSTTGGAGLSLFHLLVWHNFYGTVEKILSDGRIEGDEVNLPDSKGHGLTPFLLACVRGNLAMVRLLLEHGASDAQLDERGMNAYHFLAYPRFQDDLLTIDFKCLENSVEQRGEIARLLTCDINRKNNAGFTPLEQLLSTQYSSGYTWPLTEVFLEKGADTGYVDEDGNTLLMMARKNNHVTAAMKLMKQCPEMVNAADGQGRTPIVHAAEFRDQAMYIALKDHGASPAPQMELFPLEQITSNCFGSVNSDNKDSLSLALYMTGKLIRQLDPDDEDELGEITGILHNALVSDEEAHVLDVCREAGIDFTIPLHYHGEILCLRDECLHIGRMGVVRKLMKLGVDMERAVVKGRTPANILASLEWSRDGEDEALCEEAAKLFSRESMEQTDNIGRAAIHNAAENGHAGMLRVMIEMGVDVNLTTDEPGEAGMSPLHLACINGHADVVKLLMDAGADDTMKTLKGDTPAHLALMEKGYGRKLEAEQRADVLKSLKHLDLPNECGRTPFMLLKARNTELLPLFLESGVDVNHADNEGMTMLMLHTAKDTAKELIRAGADVNMADNEGNTALHYALNDYNAEGARYLIRKGADYNRPNNEGETPVQIAVEKGMDTVLELMTDIA